MSRWVVVATVVLLTVGVTSPVLAQDAHLGRWKLNLAKSKRDPAAPAQASQGQTRKYEVFEGDGVKLTVDSVDAAGKHTTGGYSARFDGKPYPDKGNNAWDSVSIKKIDPYTYEVTLLKAGKTYSTNTAVVSKDGKVMTITGKGMNADGHAYTNVSVWDKQ